MDLSRWAGESRFCFFYGIQQLLIILFRFLLFLFLFADHNRILNQTPPSLKSNSSKPETPTDLQENGISLNNNNNISASTAAAAASTTALSDKSAQSIRSNSRTSSPILSTINNKKTTPASSPAVANNLSEKVCCCYPYGPFREYHVYS